MGIPKGEVMDRAFWFSVPFFYFNVENSKELNRELVRDIYKWKE